MITTSHVGLSVPKLEWEFEQLGFPYLNGTGTGSIEMADAEVFISFEVEHSGSQSEPKLAVKSAKLKIEALELNIQESWFSPVYNTLLWFVEVGSCSAPASSLSRHLPRH